MWYFSHRKPLLRTHMCHCLVRSCCHLNVIYATINTTCCISHSVHCNTDKSTKFMYMCHEPGHFVWEKTTFPHIAKLKFVGCNAITKTLMINASGVNVLSSSDQTDHSLLYIYIYIGSRRLYFVPWGWRLWRCKERYHEDCDSYRLGWFLEHGGGCGCNW